MTDIGFPILDYTKFNSPTERGHFHGETYRDAIKELVTIRTKLMLAKNPKLKNSVNTLAMEQYEITKISFHPDIMAEFDAIASASGVSTTDLIILNNYTDFRDIILPDEGCTTIYSAHEGKYFAGQTWDMHSSAKNYLCVIKTHDSYILSLVGCLGMMGISNTGNLIGVNNINTTDARPGVIWPALIRESLLKKNISEIRDLLKTSPVTSGHNYLIANAEIGEHWEITPTQKKQVQIAPKEKSFSIFHTNHCIHPDVINVEDTIASSSTTHARFDLSTKNTKNITSMHDMTNFLKSHDGYPKSICSHFEANPQDPSGTCGGATFDFLTKELHFWRGCKDYDKNYKEYNFILGN